MLHFGVHQASTVPTFPTPSRTALSCCLASNTFGNPTGEAPRSFRRKKSLGSTSQSGISLLHFFSSFIRVKQCGRKCRAAINLHQTIALSLQYNKPAQKNPQNSQHAEAVIRNALFRAFQEAQQQQQVRNRLGGVPLPPQPANPMAHQGAHVKWPRFNGKKTDDPDTHIAKFESAWKTNCNRNVVDERKMNTFQSTFGDIPTEWYSQYEEDHFTTYVELKEAFLHRFRSVKTSSQLLLCWTR